MDKAIIGKNLRGKSGVIMCYCREKLMRNRRMGGLRISERRIGTKSNQPTADGAKNVILKCEMALRGKRRNEPERG